MIVALVLGSRHLMVTLVLVEMQSVVILETGIG